MRTPRTGSPSSGKSEETAKSTEQQGEIVPSLRFSIIQANEEGQQPNSARLKSGRATVLSPLTVCVDDGHVDPRGFFEDDLQTADTSITLATSIGPCPTPVSRQRGPGFLEGFSEFDGAKSPGADAMPDLGKSRFGGQASMKAGLTLCIL
jgi:hypothetical protein